jgi:hypothetical protein
MRPSMRFILPGGSARSPIPRRPKLRQRFYARRGGAVRHARCCRPDRGDGPEPSHVWRRADRRILIDAPDHLAVGDYVIVLVRPLAVGAGGGGAFEGQRQFSAPKPGTSDFRDRYIGAREFACPQRAFPRALDKNGTQSTPACLNGTRPGFLRYRHRSLPQSSSASRFTAGAGWAISVAVVGALERI